MRRRLKQATVVVIVLFAAAQLIRPAHANPPIDPSRTIAAHLDTTSALPAILDRSCNQCHSNATTWPWYTGVAPVSWVWAYSVRKGRQVVNFSDWAAYPADRQRALLVASCSAAVEGKMPGSYTILRGDARLSQQDINTICAAASRS